MLYFYIYFHTHIYVHTWDTVVPGYRFRVQAEHSATWFLYLLCQGRWFLSLVPQFCVINYNVKTLRKYWTMISESLHWVITKKCGTE